MNNSDIFFQYSNDLSEFKKKYFTNSVLYVFNLWFLFIRISYNIIYSIKIRKKIL